MLTDEVSPDLPSRVEETLAACPQFRIVLIGNTGVGKSSLVSNVFNISLKDIDIAHDRAGRADITREYTSNENPRFILHDSQGFEAGSSGNWDIVERFLRDRSAREQHYRVHAIWLCIQAPREGSRLLQTGDEKLLLLAEILHIPIIIVFTKYDSLVNEQRISALEDNANLSEDQLEGNTEKCFHDRIKDLKAAKQNKIVKVSTSETYSRRLETLLELTNVTLQCLGDPEEGASVPWAISQRISTRQKVETSISEGFKKYWRNLARSIFFQGHSLTQCTWRIHDDIIKVWNFKDPHKLLQQKEFFAKILQLVEPILSGHETEIQQDNWLADYTDSTAISLAITTPFVPALIAAGVSVLALKFLYGKYKMIPLTAQYLGEYIIALTCVLHRLFMETQRTVPPGELSEGLISTVVEGYKTTDSWRVHQLILNMTVNRENIEKVIFEYTDTDDSQQFTATPGGAGQQTQPQPGQGTKTSKEFRRGVKKTLYRVLDTFKKQ